MLGEIFLDAGAEESEERKSVLGLACERFPSSQMLKLGLLRELSASGSVVEAGDLAAALCLAELPGEGDCSRIQQALMAAGRVDETVEFTRRAIELHPGASHLRHNLGITLRNMGRLPEALEAFRGAVGACPYSDTSLTMAGSLLREMGRLEEALEFHGVAIRIDPKSALALYNLGTALLAKGELAAAVCSYERALEIRADWPELLNNLSTTLATMDRYKAAIPHLIALCRLRKDSPDDLARLAVALREANRPAEALELAEILVRLNPREPKYRMLKGASLVRVGRAADAVKEYQRAMELNPADLECCNSLIYASNYLPYETPSELFSMYTRYAERVAALGYRASCQGQPLRPFPRKLRVGYVSGDFCHHPVTTFIEPVLTEHDRSGFEVYCYYNHSRSDAFTQRLQSLPVHWRVIRGVSDEAFCELVQADEIDILVDLSGHTARNRLTALARKPARVQVTMVGCMQTTGLDTVDYRISDEWLDPTGMTEEYHSERLVRMRSGAVCFRPHPFSPEVAPLPSLGGAPFTFGSFNNLAKITSPVLDLWAAVLSAVPGSRMQVVADSDEFFLAEMAKRGIPNERFVILRRMVEVQYLEAHASVDLLLDTFPFNGLTITSNALWMGVPCVTLSGNTSASRAGTSLLGRLGLPQFVASNKEEYLRAAVYYAENPEELAPIRAGLRNKMTEVWADSVGYTRELESHFREMWRTSTGQVVSAPEQTPLKPELGTSAAPVLEQSQTVSLAPMSDQRAPLALDPPEEAAFDLADLVGRHSVSAVLPEEMDRAIEHLKATPESVVALGRLEDKLLAESEKWRQVPVCGEIWHRLGEAAGAERCFGVAAKTAASAGDWTWLGEVLLRCFREEEALSALENACAQEGASARAVLGLGCLLVHLGRWAEAEPHLRRAIGLSPSNWEGYFTLANCLYHKGRFREALRVAQIAFCSSDDPKVLINMSSYHEKCGEYVDAIGCLQKVLEKQPDNAAAYLNLGNCFLSLGMLDATFAAYEKGLALTSGDAKLYNNLLHSLTYSPDYDQPTAFARHREFALKFEAPLLPHRPHNNNRDPERRLRIAYVSPDFRAHSVAHFVEPMFQHHDHSQFEVFGVLSHTWSDDVTTRLRAYCDQWIDAAALSDEALAETLREAGIDIVVDLICHSAGSRVLMLARKPAPLQLTMIGMQQTTGLDSVDYRVTDAVMDPPGMTEQFHSEKLLRLPVAFVFNPPYSAPAVAPLPALKNGFITFGSFNNFAKVNDGVRSAWIRVLQAVPNSRFICVAPLGSGLEAAIAEAGIAADRLTVTPRLHTVAYLELHHKIDFVLDTFPFAGLTVSAVAAWMGVPTLTLAGKTSAARAGASLQHSVGLDEFIAESPDDFVEKAVKLASDFAHLAEVRASMRERMAVQFTNGDAYMRTFEAGLRQAWREWCAQNPEVAPEV